MISQEQERSILSSAYVPEHIVGLMTRVSGGEPLVIKDYFCCRKGDWVIIVGYPLGVESGTDKLEGVVDRVKKAYNPRYISLIGPEIPPSLRSACLERERDAYYTLDMPVKTIKGSVRRLIRKAREHVVVERCTLMGEGHGELTGEFIKRANPPERVRNLLVRMRDYVGHSEGAFVLNAWDKGNNLAAFYVVDVAAKDFSAYVVGCHSKKHYVPGASDLLCLEMIKISQEYGKRYIHLGLGVNEGIRRFKEKWGGTPTRKYEMCELVVRKPSILDGIRAIQ